MVGPVVRDLSVRRGTFELSCSHWVTPPGLTVLLGLNGAGKSTLLQVFAGMLRPTSGAVDRTAAGPFLPQSVDVETRLTVDEFLRYVAHVRGVDRAVRRQVIDDVMTRCGLVGKKNVQVRRLSTGWKRRTYVAQCLLAPTGALLLDEPTSNLDLEAARSTWLMLESIAAERPIIVSTHDASAAIEFATHLATLRNGVVGPLSDGEEVRMRFHASGLSAEAFMLRGLRESPQP